QPVLSRRLRRTVKGGPHLGHLDEVVQVTGLEAGVLPVVDEGEQLAGLFAEPTVIPLLPQASQDAGADDRHGRAAALAGERGELGEILAPALLVRDPAPQTEAER